MKTLFTCTLLCAICFTNAQDWCHIGSTWTYGYFSLAEQGYLSISYQKDTVVNNIPCHKLTSIGQSNFGVPGSTTPVFNGLSYYTFSRNDSVFILRKGEFVPTYFFNTIVGDTVSYLNYDEDNDSTSAGAFCSSDTIMQVIDSVGTDTINNHVLRYYVAHGINTGQVPSPEKVFERISCINNFMEPSFICGAVDGGGYSFRCYQDDSFPLYQLDPQTPCDFVSGIQTPQASINSIYPNPANNYAILQLSQDVTPLHLQVTDGTGQTIISQQIATAGGLYTINTARLSSGLYHVALYTDTGKIFGQNLNIFR